MKKSGFWLIYIILLVAQLLLSTYANFTPYVMVTMLPVMVLCMPIRMGTVLAMVIAFATGLSVDLLSEGLLGLNALALVPVAFARNSIIRLIFGGELFAREEDFSIHRNGFWKVLVAIVLSTALFLAVYIWADGAGTRPLLFNAIRFGASLVASTLLSLLVVNLLAPDSR
ncbi:MAG: rod shape-determining protein MreD [Bacteroidales bacterium]|jgi:rod shape-determining protein MreD|nr:rod shape-determining protein MreD [Bacteroidales bacterium]